MGRGGLSKGQGRGRWGQMDLEEKDRCHGDGSMESKGLEVRETRMTAASIGGSSWKRGGGVCHAEPCRALQGLAGLWFSSETG